MLKVVGMVNVVGNSVGIVVGMVIVVGNGGSSFGARMTAVVFG
jgi:hypothetical protein